MSKSKNLKVGDIIHYRLEYLEKGGDFITIDSFSKRRLVKRFKFLSKRDLFICARLSKVCNGDCTLSLLRFPNYELIL